MSQSQVEELITLVSGLDKAALAATIPRISRGISARFHP